MDVAISFDADNDDPAVRLDRVESRLAIQQLPIR
jgi:hypothetical protein